MVKEEEKEEEDEEEIEERLSWICKSIFLYMLKHEL